MGKITVPHPCRHVDILGPQSMMVVRGPRATFYCCLICGRVLAFELHKEGMRSDERPEKIH